MSDTARLPDEYEYLTETDVHEQIATGTEVFTVRALVSNAVLTVFETEEDWIGRLMTSNGQTDYYRVAKTGPTESILAPLLGTGWALEACDTDRLTATIRRASEH
jgi:hypothetical protein